MTPNRPTKPRVGLFIDTNVMGGAEVLMLKIASFASDRGFEPVLLHFDHDDLSERFSSLGFESRIVPHQDLYKSVRTLPLFCLRFRRYARSLGLSVVHSHLYGPVTAGGLALAGSNIKHVGTLHDVYSIEERPSRIRLLVAAGRLGTVLVAVSSTMEEYFRSLGSFGHRALRTIRNGVEEIQALGEERKASLRSTLGLADSDRVLISVGRLVPIKQHGVAIEALARTSDATKLLIVGSGPEEQRLKARAKDLGVAERVRFLGFRDDVHDLLSISDCFVSTSDSEGLSCSICEALAAGLPIVATDVGGNGELVREGETGFLVPVKDPGRVKDHVDSLLSEPDLYARLSTGAREFARSSLSLQSMCAQYIELYRGKT